jgi:hypothetical protein
MESSPPPSEALEAKSYKGLIDTIDAARLNKFVAASGGSGGSTSLLSKVGVPAILGLGVEYGSILQQTQGTSTTLRGNLLGLSRWAVGSQQFPYCPEIAQDKGALSVPELESLPEVALAAPVHNSCADSPLLVHSKIFASKTRQ